MVCGGWGRGAVGLFPNIEPDAPKALKTAGGWARVRRRCLSRDQGELWRVDPTPTMQGSLWTVRRQAGLPPGAMSQSWLMELLVGGACPPTPHLLVQFVCVESLVTALVDMYPRVFRKKNRREVLILGVSVTSFLVGLVMLTEVRVWGLAGGSRGGGEAKGGSLSSQQGKQVQGGGVWAGRTGGEGVGCYDTRSLPSRLQGLKSGPFLAREAPHILALIMAEGCFGLPDAEKAWMGKSKVSSAVGLEKTASSKTP